MLAISRYSKDSGLYLVAESIDCGGKGSIINAIKKKLLAEGDGFLDMRLLWPSDEEGKIPAEVGNSLYDIYGTDDIIPDYNMLKERYLHENGAPLKTLFVCEPTWARIGLKIRKKIIHEVKGIGYTAKDAAEAYAEDRHELISKLIRPAILDGIDVYCERNFCSSVVYQSSMDNPLSVDDIMRMQGNSYAAENSPHLYVICDLSADTAMERKAQRVKDDQCKFEVPEFQRRIEGKYRSEWLKALLNSYGSMIVYVNTDRPTSHEDTVSAALKVLEMFKEGKLSDGQKFNYPIQ
ncbi:MAG: hypothetical protein V1729_07240 [Candidatus Woesearchaeota archaeon]